MARPSVADERREQIIAATLKTISENGVSATTLNLIAETAEMSRGHVRHFVGNRDALLIDAARSFYGEYAEETAAILPGSITQLDDALDYLFGEYFVASTSENAIVLGFVELSRTLPEIAAVLSEAYVDAQTRIDAMLTIEYPHADSTVRADLAITILATALGNVFLEDFNHNLDRPAQSRRMIEKLLSTL